MPSVLGIHHVSAITSDALRNIDFYTGVLGLRLIKQAVNFDDPDVYHLYYGDDLATPGSVITFFVWPQSNRGQIGAGQVASVSFAISPGSVAFWVVRLVEQNVHFEGPTRRDLGDGRSETFIALRDPDGLMIELVTHPATPVGQRAERSGIPTQHAISGFHSVTIWARGIESNRDLLVESLGFAEQTTFERTTRLTIGDGGPGKLVDLRDVGSFVEAKQGAGTVHHVAWAVANDEDLKAFQATLEATDAEVSEIADRTYFKAIYAREPQDVLHELSTVQPGFTADEPLAHLGERLTIPPQLEGRRAIIEARLPILPTSREAIRAGMFRSTDDEDDSSPSESTYTIGTFLHEYVAPTSDSGVTILLLHGTGGNETSLLPIAKRAAPGAGILSLRGNVLEGAAPRFFRRHAEGVLDLEDLAVRTDELHGYLDIAAEHYGFDRTKVIAFGFSNGANIAASLLLRHPGSVAQAVLLAPMLPFTPEDTIDLTGTRVFIGAGRNDALVPTTQTQLLADVLTNAGADVTLHWEDGGHSVTASELAAVASWLSESI